MLQTLFIAAILSLLLSCTNANIQIGLSSQKLATSPVVVNSDKIIMDYNMVPAVTINPLLNDGSQNGSSLKIVSVTTPNWGAVTFTDGSISYTANGINYGQDSFSYTVQDSAGNTNSGSIFVKLMRAHTWTGAMGTSNWSTVGNWCGTVSNPGLSGVCTGAAAVPTTGDVVVFDDSCSGAQCNVTTTPLVNVLKVHMMPNYSGFITVSPNSWTVGSGGWEMEGGSFVGSSSGITVNGLFKISGGSFAAGSGAFSANSFSMTAGAVTGGGGFFTVNGAFNVTGGNFTAPSNSMTINGSIVFSPTTFSHNSGSFNIGAAVSSVTVSSAVVFNNMQLATITGTTNLNASTFNVSGNLILALAGTAQFNNGTFNVMGNLSVTSSMGLPGNAVINLIGSNSMTITNSVSLTASIPNLVINKAAAATVTFATTLPIRISGNYTYVSGTLITVGSTLRFESSTGGAYTITPGATAYGHINFSGLGQYNLGGSTLLASGDVHLAGAPVIIDNGTVEVQGDLNANSNIGAKGTAVVKMAGSSPHNIIGAAGTYIPNLEINSSSAVTFSGTLKIHGNYNWITGSVSAASSTLSFEYTGIGASTVINFGPVTYFNINFQPSGGGNSYLLGSFLYAPGGTVNVHNATLFMGGNALDSYSMDLSSGGIVTRGAGTLTVNGAGIGSGAFFGGTVNP